MSYSISAKTNEKVKKQTFSNDLHIKNPRAYNRSNDEPQIKCDICGRLIFKCFMNKHKKGGMCKNKQLQKQNILIISYDNSDTTIYI